MPSHSAQWYDTRIGGVAIWPENPAPEVPSCPRCGNARFLVIQAYAPHAVHPNRSVLLFACNNIQCSPHEDAWLAVCVIQVERDDDKVEEVAASDDNHQEGDGSNVDDINWDSDGDVDDDDDDPFNSNSENDNDDDVLISDLEQLSLKLDQSRDTANTSISAATTEIKDPHTALSSSSPKSCHEHGETSKAIESIAVGSQNAQTSELPTTTNCAFPCFYVDVEYESVSSSVESPSGSDSDVTALLERYLQDEKLRSGSGSGGEKETWGTEKEELLSDKEMAFERFRHTIAQSPEQILRYAFANGSHLIWPTSPSPVAVTEALRCQSCQGSIVFELQILASSLYYLNPDKCVAQDQKYVGLNFSTVAIFTCVNDCGYDVSDKHHSFSYQTDSFRAFSMKVFVMQDDW